MQFLSKMCLFNPNRSLIGKFFPTSSLSILWPFTCFPDLWFLTDGLGFRCPQPASRRQPGSGLNPRMCRPRCDLAWGTFIYSRVVGQEARVLENPHACPSFTLELLS